MNLPTATEADWRSAVDTVLKGKPFDTLVSTTPVGITVQPLYTSGPEPHPAARRVGSAAAPWEVRQRVSQTGQAVAELTAGATGLLVEVPGDVGADALGELLAGVHLEMAPVSLDTPADDDGVGAANRQVELWERAATPIADRAGSLGVDLIGAWARSGGATEIVWEPVADLLARLADHPTAVRVLVADGTVWHEAGATAVQELAWNVAAAVATVRAVPAAAGRIEFRWAVDADQFTGIAKMRAARQLWARVAEVAGLGDADAAFHHAETSRVMLTRYDTYTNALRSTVACFAAGVGGADAVTVRPHDEMVVHGGSPLGRRLARNTQTILQSEANLWRVVDLAGGSWYVETLTAELAAAAWAEIQRIDGLGGLVAAIEGGHVQVALDEVLGARDRSVATRRRPLTGVSEFPDIAEQPPPEIAAPAIARLTEPPFPPFGLHRLADGFESQRSRADHHERLTGERPTVYLAQLGTLAESTARTTFAKNLFESAGIRTVAGDVAGFPGGVACLCSSDAVYAAHGAAAAAELRAAGATRIYVAGRRLDLAGVDEEIGVGSDVLDVVTRALDTLLAESEVLR